MSSIYMNRELSWLKFNERVLEEAENPEVPLCERLTFASIYQSNLDEFFMVRVGSLYDQTLLDKKIRENKTGMTSQEQIDEDRLGIIPCTSNIFGRLIAVPGMQGTYMLAEELILHFAPTVFKGYKIKSKSLLRITRNADIDADALYDEDLDYREFMEGLIKQRKKLAPIRLELSRDIDKKGIAVLCEYLELDESHVFISSTPLDLSFVFQIQDLLRKHTELYFPKRTPQRSDQFQDGKSIIEQIREEDKLLSYPYESIRPFLHLLTEAAEDPDVISIKMTLYRVAKQSKVVEALIEAAENGKEVVVLVELRARFDEENNIGWSRLLEDAGCQVIYGLDGYKVHSKLCLITRKNGGQVEYITQIGTGNYNEKTSRLYTDLSLMTANVEIGLEASNVFQALSKGEVVEHSEHLLVAPKCLQNKVLAMLDEEIAHARNGEEAYAGFKLNSLTDKKIIDKLIEASEAGVKIDMVVRGICCLIPGVEGKTENIRIISIVGRFLEHSRIYIFGNSKRRKYYIASADFMTRNTVRRVEVAAPVYDERLQNKLQDMFDIMLADNQKARYLDAEGNYHRVINEEAPLNSQEYFYEQAYHEL
ncbi:polyphosphate kinase 1 [Dorea longicatena]|uniref:polyphosphate kinase 1 n=1 Tax=Dorea longicatena TaxID=88431 RepID=UPI003F896918